MHGHIIDYRSEPTNRALLLNSINPAWTVFQTKERSPIGSSGAVEVGSFTVGHEGMFAPGRVHLMPFLQGNPSQNFSMRVYGWYGITVPDSGINHAVWVPALLAELACTSCTINGPSNPAPGNPTPRILGPDEFLCDTIVLTQGNLGVNGYINSTGPGTNLVASAMLDLAGCRYFSLDFQQTDPVGMNTLFSRA